MTATLPTIDPETATTEELVAHAHAMTAETRAREAAFAGDRVVRVDSLLALPFAGALVDVPGLVAQGLLPDDPELLEAAEDYAELASGYYAAATAAEVAESALGALPTLDARMADAFASLGHLSGATTERLAAEHREAVASAEALVSAARARVAAYRGPLLDAFADLVHLAGALRDEVAGCVNEAERALLPELEEARANLRRVESKVAHVHSVLGYMAELSESVPEGGLPTLRGLPALDVPSPDDEEPEAPKATRSRK